MKRASILVVLFVIPWAASASRGSERDLMRELASESYRCYLNKPDSSLAKTERALKIALRVKDTYYEAYCYFLLAKAYWVKTNYKLSTEYGFKALKLFENSPHYAELSDTRLALARDLTELGNIPKARTLIMQALRAGIEHSDIEVQAAAYREHSYLLAETDELDSALIASDKSIELSRKLGDTLQLGVLYGRKARVYLQQSKFDLSREFAYKALALDSIVQNRRGFGISCYFAAQNEAALGNVDKAIRLLSRSVDIHTELGNLSWQIKANELLSRLYLTQGLTAQAAEALIAASRFKDELYNSEKNGQIQEMHSLHEVEAKENQIRLLEKENAMSEQEVRNQRLFAAFLLIVVLFLALLTFLLSRLRSIQTKANRNLARQNMEIEQQKLAIQSQAENLRQLDQVKTKLFSVISHDLRGPISNLQSLLDLFTRKLVTADEFVTVSEKLRENLNITQATLENLLNWSLSQMGGIRTNKRKVEVASCVEEVCALMEESASRKNLTFRKSFDPRINVWADRDQLQVILRNLIHNAIKFSAFNEVIEIRTDSDERYCHITVSDSGMGMSAQEIEAIVDPKQYFSKTGTRQEKGTGLGLLLCKEFIGRNGGELNIKSAMGMGTEVSFNLLLAEHENTRVAV